LARSSRAVGCAVAERGFRNGFTPRLEDAAASVGDEYLPDTSLVRDFVKDPRS
jgi:hypothetical protein